MAKFEKGRSGNPSGRPAGTGRAAIYRQMLDSHLPALVQKAVEMALGGDTAALRLCLERVWPALRPTDAPITIEALNTSESLSEQGSAVLDLLASGGISPADAGTVMGAIAQQARVVEVDELERRVAKLEQSAR